MTSRLTVALVLMLAALCAGTALQAQPFKYCAFGDSITCGRYDGNQCPGLTVDPLDPEAGYPARLRNLLGCTGTNCQVYNYGKGAEQTIGGVTRIGTVLNQQNFDVVLLMEGTNDVFDNVSNNTIQFNLETMADKAANHGVDTVFASIIHFNPFGPFGHSRDPQIQDLKNRLAAVANARGNWFANPWSVLCPGASCFNVHYAEIPEPDQFGLHPDASGYNVLANVFLASIQQHPVPTAPTAQSPSGNTTSRSLTWTTVNFATWYETEVDGNGTWVAGQGACGASTCSWTIPSIPPGEHTWRVRARNPRGRSPWSASKSFRYFDSPPSVPTPLDPTVDTFDTTPRFVWSNEFDATSYRIQVFDDSAALVVNQVVAWESSCGGASCSWESTITLAMEAHTWRVRAINPLGTSNFSPSESFTVLSCSPPNLTLEMDTVTGLRQEAACHTITVQNGFVVAGPNGDLQLHAGDEIVLGAGFSVESGGNLRCRVDP